MGSKSKCKCVVRKNDVDKRSEEFQLTYKNRTLILVSDSISSCKISIVVYSTMPANLAKQSIFSIPTSQLQTNVELK